MLGSVNVPPAAVPQRDDSSRRIANPAVGMRGTILRTGSETNGELFEVEFLVEPGDWTGPDHIHLRQEERFEIMSHAAPPGGRQGGAVDPGIDLRIAPEYVAQRPKRRAGRGAISPAAAARSANGGLSAGPLASGERGVEAALGRRPACWSSRSSSASTQTSSLPLTPARPRPEGPPGRARRARKSEGIPRRRGSASLGTSPPSPARAGEPTTTCSAPTPTRHETSKPRPPRPRPASRRRGALRPRTSSPRNIETSVATGRSQHPRNLETLPANAHRTASPLSRFHQKATSGDSRGSWLTRRRSNQGAAGRFCRSLRRPLLHLCGSSGRRCLTSPTTRRGPLRRGGPHAPIRHFWDEGESVVPKAAELATQPSPRRNTQCIAGRPPQFSPRDGHPATKTSGRQGSRLSFSEPASGARRPGWSLRPRARRRLALRAGREIHVESRETYGARRVHAALRRRGIRVGRKRLRRPLQRNPVWTPIQRHRTRSSSRRIRSYCSS